MLASDVIRRGRFQEENDIHHSPWEGEEASFLLQVGTTLGLFSLQCHVLLLLAA